MSTCRFCKGCKGPLIKYGVRHYAHAACMLERWGADTWARLHTWQLLNFPYFTAQRAGLGQSLVDAIAARQDVAGAVSIDVAPGRSS